jgi:hypothetical protein
MRQKVVTIQPQAAVPPVSPAAPRKLAPANQQAIDALPLNSGTWRVQGVPGLYVRCRAASESYLLQRRVRGVLVKRTLGAMPLKATRAEALKLWHQLRPAARRRGRPPRLLLALCGHQLQSRAEAGNSGKRSHPVQLAGDYQGGALQTRRGFVDETDAGPQSAPCTRIR